MMPDDPKSRDPGDPVRVYIGSYIDTNGDHHRTEVRAISRGQARKLLGSGENVAKVRSVERPNASRNKNARGRKLYDWD